MSKRVKVHVGTFGEMGKRFVSAWHRLGRGERVRERHVTFPDLPAMLNALTPKRLELLRDVHREPAASVKALAVRLGRDYKRVHERTSKLWPHLGCYGAKMAASPHPMMRSQLKCVCNSP